MFGASVAALGLVACAKPQPSAPVQDFARRHRCPVSLVESLKEGSSRLRVSGCGESDLYVRSCENKAPAAPASPAQKPLSEAEVKFQPPSQPPFMEQGCAWTRPAPRALPPPGTEQPKWLSEP